MRGQQLIVGKSVIGEIEARHEVADEIGMRSLDGVVDNRDHDAAATGAGLFLHTSPQRASSEQHSEQMLPA